MVINKVYKFRLYQNREQEILINKTFGCTRLIYNNMLALKKDNKSLTRKIKDCKTRGSVQKTKKCKKEVSGENSE